MRIRLAILGFVAAIGVVVAVFTQPAGGDCTAGIKKGHLDTTPGAFVDDETIEIDATNGLQVKALPDSKLLMRRFITCV
jgi:hypothetical protein